MRLIITGATASIVLILSLGSLRPVAAAPAELVREYAFFIELNACSDELVFIEGTFLVVTTPNNNGKYTQHAYFHGTGTGFQGNEYVYNDHYKFVTSGTDYEIAYETLLISKGSEPNERFIFYNDNGEVSGEFVCVG